MSGFITALTGSDGISSSTFWTEITAAVPLIVILIGVSFGYYVLRKTIKGAGRAKARI